MGIARHHGPQRGSQHEVDVDLDTALPFERRRVRQPPLASGMLGRDPLDREAHAARGLLQGLLDLDAFQRARAVVRQRLERLQIVLAISIRQVTLDREHADRLTLPTERDEHLRG